MRLFRGRKIPVRYTLGYTILYPVVAVLSVYLALYLAANTRTGSSLALDLVGDVIPGSISVEYLEIGPSLLSVDIWEATVRDPSGRPVIEVHHVACTVVGRALLVGGLRFSECRLETGRVLVENSPSDDVTIASAFSDPLEPKSPLGDGGLISFDRIELRDVDALLNFDEALVLIQGVDVRNGRLAAGRQHLSMYADSIAIEGGRFVAPETLWSLGRGRHRWAETEWHVLRQSAPWRAAGSEIPQPNGPAFAGTLDLPIHRSQLRGWSWVAHRFAFDRAELAIGDMRATLGGWVRFIPLSPKLPDPEAQILSFEADGSIDVPLDSPIIDYFVDELIGPPETPLEADVTQEPLRLSAYGTVRWVEGVLGLDLRDVRILDWVIRALQAQLAARDGVVHLEPGAAVQAWGGEITGSGALRASDGTYSLSLCADGVDLGQVFAPFLDDDAVRELRELASARLSTAPSRCEGSGPPGLTLRGDLTTKALELAPARTTPRDKQLAPSMLAIEAIGLRLAWPQRPSLFPSTARATASLHASLDQRGVVHLGSSALRPEGPLARPGVAMRLGDDRLAAQGRLDLVAGTVSDGKIDLSVTDLAAWAQALGVTGLPSATSLEVSTTIHGPVDDPDLGLGVVRAERLERTGGVPAFLLEANVDVEDDELLVRRATLTSDAGRAEFTGRLGLFLDTVFQLRPTPTIDGAARIEDLELELLLPTLDVAALVTSDFDISGRLDRPSVRGRLLATAIRAFGEPLDIVEATYLVDDGVVEVDDLVVVKGKGRAWGAVRYTLGSEELVASLHGRRLLFQEFQLLRELGLSIRGRGRFDASVRHTPGRTDLSASIVAAETVVEGQEVGGASFALHAYDGSLELAGMVAGDVDVYAWWRMWDGPIRVATSFRGMDLADHWPGIGDIVERSQATGRVHVYYDPFTSGILAAKLELDGLLFEAFGREFTLPEPALVRWQHTPNATDGPAQRLIVDRFGLGSGERYLRASGELVDAGELDFSIQGELDMSLLSFFPDLVAEAEGAAEVTVTVGGTVDDPQIEGALALGRARIAPRDLGASVFIERGYADISSDRVLFPADDPLRGTLFGGDFTVSGRVGLDGFVPGSLDLRAFVTNLTYRIPNQLNITLTGDVRLEAEALDVYESWRLSGDVEIVDGRFFQEFDVVTGNLAFGEIRRSVQQFSLPIWQTSPLVGAMQADLTVTGRDNFFIDTKILNADLDLELQTDAHVGGRFGAMEVLGEVQILPGSTVQYQRTTFEEFEGRLVFDGFRDDNGFPWPLVDAEGRAEIEVFGQAADTSGLRQTRSRAESISPLSLLDNTTDDDIVRYEVTARVEGRAPEALSFDFSSNPPADRRDIISLIVTGRTVDQLTAASAGSPTLEVVLRPILDTIETEAQERFDLDQVELRPELAGSTNIRVRDEITRRLSWRLDARFGDTEENAQTIRGQYKLFDWLRLELRQEAVQRETVGGQSESFTLRGILRFLNQWY